MTKSTKLKKEKRVIKGLLSPKQVKDFRFSKSLTQTGFAKHLGVATVLISMVETGLKPVSRQLLQKMANEFNHTFVIRFSPSPNKTN